MSDKSNLTFCFPPSLPPCMAEFANVFCVCFGRRSFELVRTVFYLRGMSAIVRTGPRRSSNRPRSSAKIRLSRVQKQIYLHFAEAKYLRRSQRYENLPDNLRLTKTLFIDSEQTSPTQAPGLKTEQQLRYKLKNKTAKTAEFRQDDKRGARG
mgnify:CR=1 FL=1